MIPHQTLIVFGAIFLAGSMVGFLLSANRKWAWYYRFIAFAIGVISLVLGILIPMRLWNM